MHAQSPGAAMAEAANNFLAALTTEQQAKAVFELKSDERVNWFPHPSPDGGHILVTSLRKPYSHAVTYERFAHDVEVWDRAGHATPLAQLPVADHVPIAGVPTGPRDHEWRPTESATLVWAEALDSGDWNVKVPARDKVMTQSAPFTGPATELARTEQRYAGIHWSERRGVGLLLEYDDNRHWRRTFLIDANDARVKPSLV